MLHKLIENAEQQNSDRNEGFPEARVRRVGNFGKVPAKKKLQGSINASAHHYLLTSGRAVCVNGIS